MISLRLSKIKKEKQKVLFITGSRSEYNIIKDLFKKSLKDFDSKLLVHAGHMQKFYGNFYKEINKNFGKNSIFLKTNIGISNSKKQVSLSFANQVKIISSILIKQSPSLVVITGDRTESLAAACSCIINYVPIFHLHGGELSFVSLDEKIRHSISKLSSFHFVSHKRYKKRLIQLGEEKKNIKIIGAPSLSNLANNKNNLEYENKILRKKNLLNKDYVMVCLNSCLEKNETLTLSKKLFSFLDKVKITKLVTYPNPDLNNQFIIDELLKRKKKNDYKIYKYLGQDYHIFLKNCQFLIGNSSSGIIEAPYFNKLFVNLGTRQNGREYSKNSTIIIKNFDDLNPSLIKKINKKIKNKSTNLYFKKNTSSIFINGLKRAIKSNLLKKKFIDII